jgi:hypothetical protein
VTTPTKLLRERNELGILNQVALRKKRFGSFNQMAVRSNLPKEKGLRKWD